MSGPALAKAPGNGNFGVEGEYPAGTVTVNAGGSWSDAWSGGTTDSGTWIHHGKQISMTITASSNEGDVGCVLSGKLHKKTINTATQEGPCSCSGTVVGSWYTVKTVPSDVDPTASSGRTSFAG